MNKRYVNIDDVLDLFGVEDEDLYATGTIEDALYDGTLKVYELPSAERHGRWKKNPEYHGDDVSGFIDNHFSCSVCEKEAIINAYGFYDLTPFCPNCGAKMDLKTNE